MKGFNSDLLFQIRLLSNILKENKSVYKIIEHAQNLKISDYYIGAGCIAQTVWNYQLGNDLMYGISDVDFVYFDNSDLSFEAEDAVIKNIISIVNMPEINIDIKNQARVHLWYKKHFGYDIQPYDSVESAINTWPTTATSVGVRLENNNLKIYAPFGLNDLFGMIVKANKVQITPDIYKRKAHKWISRWPQLTIVPW